ncbi:hypothetical protein FOA52_005723 [Chlamydomonas sp. UWO 241]|nr:hypothetical protein FOA52_005723 [Chlamydomonas sp. UWO 241]
MTDMESWEDRVAEADASLASAGPSVALLMNRGYCRLRLGLNRLALHDFEEAASLDPSSVLALQRKGQALVALGKPQAAAAAWRTALALTNASSDVAMVHELRAWCGNPSRALHGIAPLSRVQSILRPVVVWPLLSVAVLLLALLLSRHSFGVAGGMALSRKSSGVEEALARDPPPPAQVQQQQQQQQQQQAKQGKQPAPHNVDDGVPAVEAHNVSLAVSLAVAQINHGQALLALKLLDRVLEASPRELGGLVARGTARAMTQDYEGSVADFTRAIEVEPRFPDSYKRRAQARGALQADDADVLSDLQKAASLLEQQPGDGAERNRSLGDVYLEQGLVYMRRRDYEGAYPLLVRSNETNPTAPMMLNALGLCTVSRGFIAEGIVLYERGVALKPDLRDSWLNMAQALHQMARIQEAEVAFRRVLALDAPAEPSMQAYKTMAHMKQQAGDHLGAVRATDEGLALGSPKERTELLLTGGICYAALGLFYAAMDKFSQCLMFDDPTGNPEDFRRPQFLCFYQRDLARFMFHQLDEPFAHYCPDCHFSPLFKEKWCKKDVPTDDMVAESVARRPLPPPPSPPAPPPAHSADVARLAALADRFGQLLQNSHKGFLRHVRQQRAAGLSAIQLAQTVVALVRARARGAPFLIPSAGATVTPNATSGEHAFGWRDAMDVVTKMRQLAEPGDQVVWVDMLSRAEFESGFGSHTAMYTGQSRVIRYYMNFGRALERQKEVLLRDGSARSARDQPVPVDTPSQRAAIASASTAGDMYDVIREDGWVVLHIKSVAVPGRTMEGTRLVLVKNPSQPNGYEFSIRTPVTPPRWADFDVELAAAWEEVLDAMVADDKPRTAHAIMRYAYYWYNFMPLARGTAACGYTTMLALFWAAGMPVTAAIPPETQVDWVAILTEHPDNFTSSVSAWLYPPAARGVTDDQAAAAAAALFPDVSSLPDVAGTLDTLRKRINVLNGVVQGELPDQFSGAGSGGGGAQRGM